MFLEHINLTVNCHLDGSPYRCFRISYISERHRRTVKPGEFGAFASFLVSSIVAFAAFVIIAAAYRSGRFARHAGEEQG